MHKLVAAYLDYKPDVASATQTQANDVNVEMLMASAPQIPDHLKFKRPNHG